MRKIIIGIDGGGTKTNFAAFDIESRCFIAQSTAKGINISSWGLKGAVKNLLDGIQMLGLQKEDHITAISIGDPSVDDDGSVPHLLKRELENSGQFPDSTKIYSRSDVFMALYAFSGGEPAALVVAGTGSMAVAAPKGYRHNEKNELLTVGGWGGISPDRGSGYDIAATALIAAMDSFDKIAAPTALCEAALKFFKAEKPRDLIPILGVSKKRSEIAAFSVQVDVCAMQGDNTAAKIIQNAGSSLGKYAVSLLRRMNPAARRVGIYGSVLLNSQGVRTAFESEIRREFPDAVIEAPSRPPEAGAVYYALDALDAQASANTRSHEKSDFSAKPAESFTRG